MNLRQQQKQASLDKILKVASVKLREEGIDGAAIAPVMEEAGLTHGAFYAHFDNKDELARAAFEYALDQSQPSWFGHRHESFVRRLRRLAARYLAPAHRDDVGHGCAISALASYAPRASGDFRAVYQARLLDTIDRICDDDDASPEKHDQAIAFLALCVGGLTLSRAVDDQRQSARILRACRDAVDAISA